MQRLALIDYGSGNLRSAEKALVKVADGQAEILVTSDPETIARADRVVLPGVGAFAACMAALQARDGAIEAMSEAVRTKGRPFLGVCVGMQLLATRGLEFGETAGLDWIPGEVRKLAPLAKGEVYFTHSFAIFPDDPADVAASVEHGGRFPAAVARGNVAGVQFHPEKSQKPGLALLARFLEWRP